jgi:hypothetical protein
MTSQINACRSGAFPTMAEEDEDESPHMDMDETDEEVQDTGPAFDDDLDSEVDDFTIEKDDCVFMAMVHPVDPHHFVCASSTVSGCLVEAFAKNSKPKGFEDIVPIPMPMSSVKQPSTPSQSAASGTTPLSWSASPHPDSAKSIQLSGDTSGISASDWPRPP